MSLYPISGCGMPSKPRAAQPSMFEILSWPGENELTLSRFQQPQQKIVIPICQCNKIQQNQLKAKTQNISIEQNSCPYCRAKANQIFQPLQARTIVEQIYKENKSPLKATQSFEKPQATSTSNVYQNESKEFTKSKICPKQIKNYLYSYEPVNLKPSRSKSTFVGTKQNKKQEKPVKKQEPQLDYKTIQERKHNLKQFEVFTRLLPNSAFTTYYGKPTFEAYGRGTSCNNLKSFNVMPHKGDNHPKHLESHYTALIKARNIKSKSYLPRKPVQQNQPQSRQLEQSQQPASNFDLPLEKPDLIKSKRFATIVPQTSKKAGPPVVSGRRIQEDKKNKTGSKQTVNKQKRPKTSKKAKKGNDGLKYINDRQGLIELLEQKKLKASQLAYKVTQCYPLQFDASRLQKSVVSKENWYEQRPAGKATLKSDLVSDLLQSQLVLKQGN